MSVDGHRLVLHSFPTRRSSDLLWAARAVVGGLGKGLHHLRGHAVVEPDLAGVHPINALDQQVGGGLLQDRSEEHTSELQSLRHLVCRLLLEKKKQIEEEPYTIK